MDIKYAVDVFYLDEKKEVWKEEYNIKIFKNRYKAIHYINRTSCNNYTYANLWIVKDGIREKVVYSTIPTI